MWDLLETRVAAMAALGLLSCVGLLFIARALAVLERRALLEAPQDERKRSLRTDLAYVLLSPATEALARLLTTLGLAACALVYGHALGPELLRGFGPVIEQPRALVVIEMLVLSDFLYYFTHRLAHAVPALWRLHAVHHSSEHLRWSSALRAHPAEAYTHLLHSLPLVLLGFPVDALANLAPVSMVYALFIHSSLNVTLRPLSYLVNTPRFHGHHHARDVQHGTVNYGGFFPLFDAIFGTYRLPDAAPAAYGIDDPDMPVTFLEQLAYPLRARSAHVMLTPHDPHPASLTSALRTARERIVRVLGPAFRTLGAAWPSEGLGPRIRR
jgi:sterol desaturase/sphingolipid hydroxylase (fatty acid hydroxylase superfamily)